MKPTTAEGTGDESDNGYICVSGSGHEECFAEANRLRAELEKAREVLKMLLGEVEYHEKEGHIGISVAANDARAVLEVKL